MEDAPRPASNEKRFKPFGGQEAGAFNVSERDPLPEEVRRSLEVVSQSFCNSHMRNLDLIRDNQDGEARIFGLLTHYQSHGVCWVQPTLIRSQETEYNYDRYMRHINNLKTRLQEFDIIEDGLDCVAKYRADHNWYRGVIICESPDSFGEWEVLFVDYGNTQTCGREEIRRPVRDVQLDHFHAPQQAVCCRLYNIVPHLPSLQARVDKYMRAWVAQNANKFVEFKVKNIRPDYVIDCDLFICNENEETEAEEDENNNTKLNLNRFYRRHIGQDLVDMGVAKFADPGAAHAFKLPEPRDGDVKPDIKPDVKPDVKSFKMETMTGFDVKPDVKPDIKPDIKPVIEIDMEDDVKPDIKPDIKPVVKMNMEHDLKPDVKPDIKPKVEVPCFDIDVKPKLEQGW